MKLHTISLALLLGSGSLLFAAPAEINYQGRLTDSNGDPAPGNYAMSIAIYDASSSGNLLYEEDLGNVTVNDYGVYSFSFGAGGQSTVEREETVAFTDGISKIFTGATTSTPIPNSVSVSDGTFSWNQAEGNPGTTATATASITGGFVTSIVVVEGGSGYDAPPDVAIDGDGTGASATASLADGSVDSIAVTDAGSGYTNATVTIEAPPNPFTVSESSGSFTFQYESPPPPGRQIVAIYETQESSLIGALQRANQPWLELSVNGVPQTPRERILSVPFAQVAGQLGGDAQFVSTESLSKMLDELAWHGATTDHHRVIDLTEKSNLLMNQLSAPWTSAGIAGTPQTLSVQENVGWGSFLVFEMPEINTKITSIKYSAKDVGYGGHMEVDIIYKDGSVERIAKANGPFSNQFINDQNPFPDKTVDRIEYRGGVNVSSGGSIEYLDATYTYGDSHLSFSVNFLPPLDGNEFISYIGTNSVSLPSNQTDAIYYLSNNSNTFGPFRFTEKITTSFAEKITRMKVELGDSFKSGEPVNKILIRRFK